MNMIKLEKGDKKMNMIKLENGNIVSVVTMDTDTTSREFFGVYRTLNLAIAEVKLWFTNLNEASSSHQWEMTSTSQDTQTWTCKNFGNIKTMNFSKYGL